MIVFLDVSCVGYLLSLVATLVELLLERGVGVGLFVGLTGRIALVLQITLDLFVVRSLLSRLLQSHILPRPYRDITKEEWICQYGADNDKLEGFVRVAREIGVVLTPSWPGASLMIFSFRLSTRSLPFAPTTWWVFLKLWSVVLFPILELICRQKIWYG